MFKVDYKTLKILKHLALSRASTLFISRTEKIPQPTVYRRIENLKRIGEVKAIPDYFKLGLRPIVVFTDIKRSKSMLFYDLKFAKVIKSGSCRNFIFLALPYESCRHYIKTLLSRLPETRIQFSFTPFSWRPDLQFLEVRNRILQVLWGKLYRHIIEAEEEPAILEPSPPMKFDKKDLFILKELEEDGLQSLREIARKLSTYPELVSYHYKRHVSKIITGYRLNFPITPRGTPWRLVEVKSSNREGLIKVTLFFMKTPWLIYGFPLRDEFSVLAILVVPFYEEESLFRALSLLEDAGVVEEWRHVGYIEKREYAEKSIPVHLFKKKKWIDVTDEVVVEYASR